jgi:predicted membrane protein
MPAQSLEVREGRAVLTLKGGREGRPRFRMPWSACNGATEWQIHLNPGLSSDITAHSDGGNLRLDMAGFCLSSLSAGTGGGNVELVLPQVAADLHVTAISGAGNVDVLVPSSAAVRVQATTGLGKAIVDPSFSKIDRDTYQSAGFDGAANKIEIVAKTGAGNVIVHTA